MTIFDHLKMRSWIDVRAMWLEHTAGARTAGAAPISSVEDVIGFGDIAERTRSSRVPETAYIAGIHAAVLEEGLFLLHKAVHVTGAAEIHLERGICTWSLSEAYQGAYFGIRAILHLLGVALADYKGKTVIVDLWSEQTRLKAKKAVPLAHAQQDSLFVHFGKRMDHQDAWKVFQRLVGVARVPMWSERCVGILNQIDLQKLTRQRNQLHYHNCYWLLDDLYEYVTDTSFGRFAEEDELCDIMRSDREDQTIATAFVILRMALQMLESFQEVTNALRPDWDLVATSLSESRHPLFRHQSATHLASARSADRPTSVQVEE